MKIHLSKMGLSNTCIWGWSLRYSRPVAKVGYSNIAETLGEFPGNQLFLLFLMSLRALPAY